MKMGPKTTIIAKRLVAMIVSILVSIAVAMISDYVTKGEVPFPAARAHSQKLDRIGLEEASLDDLGGIQDVKETVRSEILVPMQNHELFYSKSGYSGVSPPRGVLLCGPPGVGKTMIARAIARDTRAAFIHLSLADLEAKFYGESPKKIKAAFELARKSQPCVIFFDEIDGMMRTRSESDQACVFGFKTEMLQRLDELHRHPEEVVLVIGCTNCPHLLDSALRRRMPLVIDIPLPSSSGRKEILEKMGVEPAIAETASMLAEGFTGADLKETLRQANAKRLKRALNGSSFTPDDLGPLLEEDVHTAVAQMLSSKASIGRDLSSGSKGLHGSGEVG